MKDSLCAAISSPLRPSASPPARHPHGGGLSFCRPSGRPASTKHTSATAARRSPVTCARRPRSRLGSPARLRWSGGRHRFRQASSPPVQVRRFAATFPVSPPPAFIHARRTGLVQRFLHDPEASTGPCILPSLRSDVDLLCPLSTLSFATGQAFTLADPNHASSFSLP